MRALNRILVAVTVLIISGLAASFSHAQESGTIQATATVLPALSVTGLNDLRFETVIPGVNKSVDKASVGHAGEFRVTGHDSAEISIDFDLPTDLLLDSTATMAIAFTNTDASYDDGTGGGQTAPTGIVNPNGPSTQRLGDTGELRIWIGGMVQPTITQTGGNYAADITLTVVYTGN